MRWMIRDYSDRSSNQTLWLGWRAFIKAAFGLGDMTPDELAIYRKCTGRQDEPSQQMRDLVLCCGRRSGKSKILALIAVWIGCFHDFKPYLSAGELGVVQLVASDRDQARVLLRYIKAYLRVPMLKRMIVRETQFRVELSNSISIEITTASYRSVRGRTVVCCLADEVAFWSSDELGANPAEAVIAAIRPAMATVAHGAMLLISSSPYARRGPLWTMHKAYHAKDDPRVLSFQAATDVLNPTVPADVIAQAYEDDPASASAEYGAQFRSDVSSLVPREAIEAVTSDERQRPHLSQYRYHAFCDPAGGSGQESFTIAIGHVEGGTCVLDLIDEAKPPFSPKAVVEKFSKLLKDYKISKVLGDRFAGEWPREQFREHGINYDPSAKPKSQLYGECLPLINSKKCDLLDNERLLNQFVGLERRTARSGKDLIDHAPNGHDDVANAVAGVLTNMGVRKYRYVADMSWVGDWNSRDDQQARSRAAEHVSHFVATKGL